MQFKSIYQSQMHRIFSSWSNANVYVALLKLELIMNTLTYFAKRSIVTNLLTCLGRCLDIEKYGSYSIFSEILLTFEIYAL